MERPPVWAMRQAGRWDPEFNKLRAGHSFYEFSENVDLAAKASLGPKRFGVDAIILFYDITTLAVAMGLPFALAKDVGPVPERPIRTSADLNQLDANPDSARFQHVRDLLALVRASLHDDLPILVFAGAPFTLATYCIGTGKDLTPTRKFASEHPQVWGELLEKICSATIGFLGTLVADGADAFQLFDSWAGSLSPTEYQTWAQIHHQQIFTSVRAAPSILFVKECPYLDEMTRSGANVISLGVTHDLARARARYPNLVFQGNVSDELLRTGAPQQVAEATASCVAAGGGRHHIVNLSHGCNRDTPVANFEAFVAAAKDVRRG